ncbi:hypothetical protein ES705_17229 [subsurface metagenome]
MRLIKNIFSYLMRALIVPTLISLLLLVMFACGSGGDQGPGPENGEEPPAYVAIPANLIGYEGTVAGIFDRDLQNDMEMSQMSEVIFQPRYIIKEEDMYGGVGVYPENMRAAYSYIGLIKETHLSAIAADIMGQDTMDTMDFHNGIKTYDTSKEYHGTTKTESGVILLSAYIPDADFNTVYKDDAFTIYDAADNGDRPIIFDYSDPDHSINMDIFPERGVTYSAICLQLVYLETEFQNYGTMRIYYKDYNGRMAGDVLVKREESGWEWKYIYFKMGDGADVDGVDDRSDDCYLGRMYDRTGVNFFIANNDPIISNYVEVEYFHDPLVAYTPFIGDYIFQIADGDGIIAIINDAGNDVAPKVDFLDFMINGGFDTVPGLIHWETDNHVGPADQTQVLYRPTSLADAAIDITSHDILVADQVEGDKTGHLHDSGYYFNIYPDKTVWYFKDPETGLDDTSKPLPPDAVPNLLNSYIVWAPQCGPEANNTMLEVPLEDGDPVVYGDNQEQPNPIMQIEANVFLKSWLLANMDLDSIPGDSFEKFLIQPPAVLEDVYNGSPGGAWSGDSGLDIYADFVTGAFELSFNFLRWMDLNTLPPEVNPPSGDHLEGPVVVSMFQAGQNPVDGGRIYYTTDGTSPAVDSEGTPKGTTLEYNDEEEVSIDISSGEIKIVKAIAKIPGKAASSAITAQYYIDTAELSP